MSTQQPASYRPHAVFLVGASAGVLLFLSGVLQLAVWDLPDFYRSKGLGLPQPTKIFFDAFGHRPDAYLSAVVFWLWWPLVAALAYCHHRHREPQAFAVAFLYWFACCWTLAAMVLAFMAHLCLFPMLAILLADLEESPDYMWVISMMSWSLPVAVVLFAVACWLRFRRASASGTHAGA